MMGSATVFIVASILKQLGCIRNKSILLEMLGKMPLQQQQIDNEQ